MAELYRQNALFDRFAWQAEIDGWVVLLDPLMGRPDPHQGYSYDDWQRNVVNLREFARSRADTVRTELEDAGFVAP